ncbi:CoxG family protein [Burkholderia lata]|uniref:CoxG family protein n=1 Tax=Burkholderia lata (strain ATCC 17760 / DSM 23089 / LMG 22485 / NCIMB 9086 / R18194 / 383) TaxID=482957 RepID=UPI001452BAA2|nr:SRPBCC family protein [Burkholderia lata]VWC21180.1 hypothetical protein BLA15816_05905 [Burkholderia lata]
MELEKKVVIDAPIDKVWGLLLDPSVMAGCVPGTESVEVISDVEYLASVKVKISFISARFRIRTTVLETRPPFYLKSEGTGEDSSVGSSLKQASELRLAELPDGRTELSMVISVDVFGRLGSFGLAVMKTKADRMWEEFGANLNARAIAGSTPTLDGAMPGGRHDAPPEYREDAHAGGAARVASDTAAARMEQAPREVRAIRSPWWRRLLPTAAETRGSGELYRLPTDIVIEIKRRDSTIRVIWPAQQSPDCVSWLKDYLK